MMDETGEQVRRGGTGGSGTNGDGKPASAPEPGYMRLHREGRLSGRAAAMRRLLSRCVMCPRRCRVDRSRGELGVCGTGSGIEIAAVGIHLWEEPPISGTRGSGTVFFSGCALRCVFCQNYPISQMGVGRGFSARELAEAMLELQAGGAHNINLVTSTHQMAGFLEALVLAVPLGLRVPIVYNTSGYETEETLRLLNGIVDIYLPDIKYSDPRTALRYSGCADYVAFNRRALLEMWRQVGPLQTNGDGVACRGMMVRHLVLPADAAGTRGSFAFLAEHIGPELWVSLMNQYFPAHKALNLPPLDRKVTDEEYGDAFRVLSELEFENGFTQTCSTGDEVDCLPKMQ